MVVKCGLLIFTELKFVEEFVTRHKSASQLQFNGEVVVTPGVTTDFGLAPRNQLSRSD